MTKVLFIHNYNPVIHGASLIGNNIYQSHRILDEFDAIHINSSFSRSNKDIGKFKFSKAIGFFALLTKICYYIIFFKPDKYYTNYALRGKGIYTDFLIHLLLKRRKKIIHLHNQIELENLNWLQRFCIRFSLKDAQIINLSKSISLSFKDWSSNRSILYNGIRDPLEEFKLNLKERSINSDKIKLLFCSNLFGYKGVNDLIHISTKLKSSEIDFQLTIIGAEGDISGIELHELIRNNKLENNVTYLGPKFNIEKIRLFIESDLFVYPTHYDSMPIVLIESLACGLPIVSYDVGGINEILNSNECGSIIKRARFDLMTEEIITYSRNKPLLETKAKNSRKRYESLFSLKTFELGLIDIITER